MTGDRAAPRDAAAPRPSRQPSTSHDPALQHVQAAAGDDVPEAARDLLLHRLDLATGNCTACGQPCPCPHANAAASVLARAGHWNQPPPSPVPGTRTRPVRLRRPWYVLTCTLLRRRKPPP